MTFEWNPVLSGPVGGLVTFALGLFVSRAKAKPAPSGQQVLRYHGAMYFFVFLGLGLVGHQELLDECSRRSGLPVPGEGAGSQL